MAEPLLKRTFSRLRGKDRTRRKTDPKLNEAPVLQTSSSPSSPSLMTSSRTADLDSPPRNHITVAKKQQWARQGSLAPPSSLPAMSQDAPGQVWSQRAAQQQTPQFGDWRISAQQPEAPSQRAYLQSLDRSSRAWVLSSGKSQASDEALGPQENSGSNIWYNPIPEEDDSCGPRRDEDVWRRRDDQQEAGPTDGPLEDANPSISHHVDDITAECPDSPPSDSSPASQKKGGVSGSVIDRLRSPGTVRKLSMKMKKLPELRRKLSLRSSSRAHRHGNDGRGGGDEATNKSAALSNQNVISRYHLDSSATPARPLRRSSRGRSASKGGYLSDGDSPELLPRQQAPQPPQEVMCDISSFRLYVGSDPPRCSQRVTGLLTVHLLGLEEMKSGRSEGSKEVFLAIQVDGVTRARTALLTLRGSALSLNHTFHLELERARQLRIVILTPGTGTKARLGNKKTFRESVRWNKPTLKQSAAPGTSGEPADELTKSPDSGSSQVVLFRNISWMPYISLAVL